MLLAEAYIHRLDPVAFEILGLPVRWYGLSYAVGFVIGWLIVLWFARTRRSPLRPHQVGDLMTWVIVGVLVGGRLGYALFYRPDLLVGFSSSFPWWDLLAINKGGMASHGGIIGVIFACLLYGRRHGVHWLHLLDMGALACTPGLFLGRLANFVNAELWGRPIPDQASPPWWSVKYPQEILLWAEDDPRLLPLHAIGSQLDATGIELRRAVIAAIERGDTAVIEAVRPLLTAYYPSQILQAITDGPILFAVLALIWIRPRRPGIVGGSFLVTYGILRIATEFVRQPDEGVAVWLGLSRGQWLSVLMILVGAITIIVQARKTELQRYGGWKVEPEARG